MSIIIFVDVVIGNVWEIWGKFVNDWDNVRKKIFFIKVYVRGDIDSNLRFNYLIWLFLRFE